jgi:hypothetical protein
MNTKFCWAKSAQGTKERPMFKWDNNIKMGLSDVDWTE